jgi:hypothetical protein
MERPPVSVSRISAATNVYQTNNNQTSVGQLRSGFRWLIQSIKNGNLEDAEQAYNTLNETMPQVFESLSLQLKDDYKAIGNALLAQDISGAQKAVVQLQRDLQSIGPTNARQSDEVKTPATQDYAPATTGVSRRYHDEARDPRQIGTRIDIKV